MNEYYSFLMCFTGTKVSRNYLLRKYTPEFIDKAIELGYIKKVSENDIGDAQYMITQLGKSVRDN